MQSARSSGVLLHPTSLPGRFGCGDLGPEAWRFLDFLAESRQTIWQVLPLGPTGYGDSPYQSFSSFAGNPLLISLDRLLEDDLLLDSDVRPKPTFPDQRVNYGTAIPFKARVLAKSFERFRSGGRPETQARFDVFCRANAAWLDDFTLFMALKEVHGGAPWHTWEPEIAARQPDAMRRWGQTLSDARARQAYLQFLFFDQWTALKAEANRRGIRLIGDVPIFVAHDSADVWAQRELFCLDQHGRPTVVAGVPPDYFSATGQLWGNPIYRWDVMRETGYHWWIERLRAALRTVDLVRLDHFRGFEAYWEVPGGDETAINGRWVKGPADDLFHALRVAFNVHTLPIIAEDLGVITPEVVAMRERFELPGMKVLQFVFGGGNIGDMDPPYAYPHNGVVYTGTHDNDTALGWFRHSSLQAERELALAYMGSEGREFNWDFIRLAMSSVSDTVIVPLQDVLGLDSVARMNYPGRSTGNWSWRCLPGALTPKIAQRLAAMTELYGRAGVE